MLAALNRIGEVVPTSQRRVSAQFVLLTAQGSFGKAKALTKLTDSEIEALPSPASVKIDDTISATNGKDKVTEIDPSPPKDVFTKSSAIDLQDAIQKFVKTSGIEDTPPSKLAMVLHKVLGQFVDAGAPPAAIPEEKAKKDDDDGFAIDDFIEVMEKSNGNADAVILPSQTNSDIEDIRGTARDAGPAAPQGNHVHTGGTATPGSEDADEISLADFFEAAEKKPGNADAVTLSSQTNSDKEDTGGTALDASPAASPESETADDISIGGFFEAAEKGDGNADAVHLSSRTDSDIENTGGATPPQGPALDDLDDPLEDLNDNPPTAQETPFPVAPPAVSRPLDDLDIPDEEDFTPILPQSSQP